MALQQWLYIDKMFSGWTSAHLHIYVHVLYFHTIVLSNGQVFHQSVAMLRANGHANVLTMKIAASELAKKTAEVTKWRRRPRNWRRKDQMVTRSRWQTSQRREQWRLHRIRPFCRDWGWDWASAETTTRVIDWESGLSEYADIWCTILYNECGGRKLVTGKEYPQTKREYRQIVISRLKVICHKHWHVVDWKEMWPWKVICVYFEWCNVWGGSIPVVQIASKMTSIDQDIAPSEGVSGEPYYSSSVREAGRYWNIQQQWYFCAHSTVRSFLSVKFNRQ